MYNKSKKKLDARYKYGDKLLDKTRFKIQHV